MLSLTSVFGTKTRGEVLVVTVMSYRHEGVVDIPTFSMETPESIRAQMRLLDWAASIDLSDAYYHIPIHPKFRRFLTFCHRGTLWQFRALSFGLSAAPWIFTRVMEEVKKMAAVHGITMHTYIDDWLIT